MREAREVLHLLQDPEKFSVHRLAAHSDHVCLDREGKPLGAVSLDGEWRFALFEDMETLLTAMRAGKAPEGKIRVPGHWQTQGWGRPQYVNTQYPWDGTDDIVPPQLPARNPLGLYQRRFDLPETWGGRAVRLVIEGAEPCCVVYCNGSFVGYSEDSFTPAAFDLTPFLRGTDNALWVIVPRFCTGSWLEDQDFWRFSGLFRSVRLYAVEPVHIEDMDLRPALSPDFRRGTVALRATILAKERKTARAALCAAGCEIQRTFSLAPGVNEWEMELAVPQPLLWSAETPHLYELELRITGEDGAFLAGARQKIGFRSFCLQDGLMRLNGKRVVFRGVNRHEWSCRTGRAVSREEMEWDVRTLKQNNFNAVRLSHYPNQSYFYELCDTYGLYVMDETNLETHGTWMSMGRAARTEHTLPGDHPQWREAVLDRGRSMLERDKNHPCVLFWSCGNESAGGATLFALSQWFRRRDSSRLVHYEGIFYDRAYPDTSDVESRMYAKPEEIASYLSGHPTKPYISCEYAHAMGNSFGNTEEYTALEDRFPLYQGGFIWDFIDQALLTAPAGEEPYLAVGGDFGDRPNDGYFCGDGLVFADRTLSPKMEEARFLYAPLVITCSEQGVRVRSRRLFLSTKDIRFTLTLAADGRPIREEVFRLEVPPEETGWYPLSFALPETPGELTLTCTAALDTQTRYAGAGHEVAFGQAVLKKAAPREAPERPAVLLPGNANIGVDMGATHALISKATGELYSYRRDGVEYLETPLRPDFWRAPTDNDRGSGQDVRWAHWKTASLYRTLLRLETDVPGGTVTARYAAPGTPAITYSVTYRCFAGGRVEVTLALEAVAGTAPCAGFTLGMPAGYDRLSWYGNTQRESYCDRQNGCRLGLGTALVKDRLTPYLHTQECGNLTELRLLRVGDGQGRGLRFTAPAPFEGTVLPYTSHELEQAECRRRLPPATRTVVGLYAGKSGVGGDDSWGARVHEKHLLHTDQGLCFSVVMDMAE